MPLETFVGSNMSTLMQQAQRRIGADAVILHTRRTRTPTGHAFEIVAADARTAARHEAARSTPSQKEAITPASGSGPAVIALVGPTGSGKTTTLAKVATHPRVFAGRRVGFVTLDTYRVGAVDQMKMHAEIAKVPLEVVYTEQDVAALRERMADREVWLVDTPGRGPRHRRDREAAEALLRAIAPTEVHLVLPATLPVHLAAAAIRDARRLGVTHLLATKMDEAPDETTVTDLAVEHDLAMRWTAAGQEVPFDLVSASDAMEASRLSRGTLPMGGVG